MDQSLLDKFFNKKATTKEIKKIVDWYFDKEVEQSFDETLNSELESNQPHPAFAKEAHFERVLSQAENATRLPKTKSLVVWKKIAAAVAIIFVSTLGIYYLSNNAETQKQQAVAIRKVTKSTEKGQKLTTYLPDGSKVVLNSESKISYQIPFEKEERFVELVGEAFFEVTKNPDLPFKVSSGNVTTTALGTSFNIDYRSVDNVKVALVTGKVRVAKDKANSLILTPGKIASLNGGGQFEVGEFQYLDAVSWKDGTLYFNKSSLSEIVSKLEQWYGVEIKVKNNFKDEFHYTGVFREESLEKVLKGISFVHRFDYSINGTIVEIEFQNHKN